MWDWFNYRYENAGAKFAPVWTSWESSQSIESPAAGSGAFISLSSLSVFLDFWINPVCPGQNAAGQVPGVLESGLAQELDGPRAAAS